MVDKDIQGVGVGEMVAGLDNLKNFEWVVDVDEVDGSFNYVFDFVGKRDDWEKVEGEKFILISVDDNSRRNYLSREAAILENDWRIVEAKGVYGERMGEDTFLAKVIKWSMPHRSIFNRLNLIKIFSFKMFEMDYIYSEKFFF